MTLFCMPTSTDTVRLMLGSKPSSRLSWYPKRNPPACVAATAATARARARVWELVSSGAHEAKAEEASTADVSTDTGGITRIKHSRGGPFGTHSASATPTITGASTSFTTSQASAPAFRGTSDPAVAQRSAGVMSTEASVEHVVSTTESATLPLATCVTTLDAAPPGQQDTSMSPAATDVSSPSSLATLHPIKGMTVYCRPTPASTAPGILHVSTKSWRVSVKPMEANTKNSPTGNISRVTPLNTAGVVRASTAPMLIHNQYSPA
eukprot:CAMPEP_0114288474 /NCGR_PEP_ID=MMETSP0059-20121206/6830_1 /TAXON_ID=36894 /ORGANISM="Pyramimonas parkeae, Strain CCMP726" /LENGTH=264 /DNA_ID=CAMNT_0001409623 /DNA_START=382 /DNA_END=1172 /DNA_ORIENTATION=+